MFYMYVLKSLLDNKLYIGSANNLKRRLVQQNNGNVPSTAPRSPFELVYYEAYKIEGEARGRESRLKQRGQAFRHLKTRIDKSLN